MSAFQNAMINRSLGDIKNVRRRSPPHHGQILKRPV